MSNLERLHEAAKTLPEDLAGEVLDFLEFAKARREREDERKRQAFDER